MSGGPSPHRASLKGGAGEAMRQAAEQRRGLSQLQSKATRAASLSRLRGLIEESHEDDQEPPGDQPMATEDPPAAPGGGNPRPHAHHHHAQRTRKYKAFVEDALASHDWVSHNSLLELYQGGWAVAPRPEGVRCAVIASKGVTIAASLCGHVLSRFQSKLPFGSRSGGNGHRLTVLDCVYEEDSGLYMVLDVLLWGGVDLSESPMEMRSFFVSGKLEEEGVVGFSVLPWRPATRESVGFAYSAQLGSAGSGAGAGAGAGPGGAARAGLIFARRDAPYPSGQLTTAIIQWVEVTPPPAMEVPRPILRLRVAEDGALCTRDGVSLGVIGQRVVDLLGLKHGAVMRVSVAAVAPAQTTDGSAVLPVLVDPHFAGLAEQDRPPDSIAKVLFHARPITIQELASSLPE